MTVGTPVAPAAPTVVAGNASASLSWVAPADNGSAINGYVVTPFVGSVAQPARTFASTATTQVVTGLTNGTTYTFRVAAKNAIGTGAQSAGSSAMTVGAPLAPAAPSAVAANASASVSWVAPGTNGSAITGYVVTPFVGSAAQPSTTFASTATTQTVTGLTDGTTYTFRVAAKNAIGTGPQSAASSAVVVGAVPVANAGPDQTVTKASVVQLDAGASTDPGGGPLNDQWTQIGGPVAVLDDPRSTRPKFTAPDQSRVDLTFRVTVTNRAGHSSFDDVVIHTK